MAVCAPEGPKPYPPRAAWARRTGTDEPGGSTMPSRPSTAPATGTPAPAVLPGRVPPLRLFNTLTGTEEPAAEGDRFSMYVCGPTVYDFAHVGHGRSYVVYDVVKRYLIAQGVRVHHAQNYTDIEESIGRRAAERGITPGALAEQFIEAFRSDMDALRVLPADAYPRASVHVPRMISIVEDLVHQGYAYYVDCRPNEADAEPGKRCDVYFDVQKAAKFGALAGRPLESMSADVPVLGERRHALDFALWKSRDDWGVTFPSPFGPGRPGWHIECVAMSTADLGQPFDLHGGGFDLIFPHHDSEKAIAEAWQGKRYARLWVHNGFVNIDGEKMSKSKGNFRTIRDLLAVHPGEVLRQYLLATHYREPLLFSDEAVLKVEAEVRESGRILSALLRKVEALPKEAGSEPRPIAGDRHPNASPYEHRFWAALARDLHTEEALVEMMAAVRAAESATGSAAAEALQSLRRMGDALGLLWPLTAPRPASLSS
jgi:cysteinyl-tRNA synthetase